MKQQVTRLITTGLLLLSLCFFSGALGALAPESNHLLGSLLLGVLLLALTAPVSKLTRVRLSRKRVLALGAITLVLIIDVVAQAPMVWIAAACLLAFG